MKPLPRTVIYLGFVSFFTDLSSEMIYPLLPIFLSSVLGAGAVALGVIEGTAESTAAFLKVISGLWTDRLRHRKPLILPGYGLSGAVRPLIGLATAWPLVLVLRFMDRVGKGLRTSHRDALIADVTNPGQRGAAYGLHRAMDHAGAVVGPIVAAGLLAFESISLRHIFLLSAIPAAVVMVVLIAGVKEPRILSQKTLSHRPWLLIGVIWDVNSSAYCWHYWSSPWATPRTPFFSFASQVPVSLPQGWPCSGPCTMESRCFQPILGGVYPTGLAAAA